MAKRKPSLNPKDRVGLTKVQVGLVPSSGIIECARALEDGAGKYGPYNWRKEPIRYTVYLDAIERHILDLRDGEDCALDSKVHHLGHIMAGAAIAMDAIHNGLMVDDRPPKGKASELFERYKKRPKKGGPRGNKR